MDTLGELKPNYGGLVKKKTAPLPADAAHAHTATLYYNYPRPWPISTVGGDGSNSKIARHQIYDKIVAIVGLLCDFSGRQAKLKSAVNPALPSHVVGGEGKLGKCRLANTCQVRR